MCNCQCSLVSMINACALSYFALEAQANKIMNPSEKEFPKGPVGNLRNSSSRIRLRRKSDSKNILGIILEGDEEKVLNQRRKFSTNLFQEPI